MPYIPRAQLQQIIEGFNATSADYPREQCVHALIEQQARATPDAVALAFDGATVRYRDLDERANRLAHHLRARIGSDGGRIGVLVERSPDMVVALLAIWKAGFAYVPLDPSPSAGAAALHPLQRRRFRRGHRRPLSGADASPGRRPLSIWDGSERRSRAGRRRRRPRPRTPRRLLT